MVEPAEFMSSDSGSRRPMTMNAAAIGTRLLEAWNSRDLETFVSLLHEQIVWYDPAMPAPPARGRQAVRAFAITVLEAFPDFAFEVRHPICVSEDGTRCVIPWRIRATASGWMRPPGFAPTGRKVSFDGVDVLDCDGEKVTRIETYFDAVAASEQLLQMTLRPKPGSFREKMLITFQRTRAAWLRRRAASD